MTATNPNDFKLFISKLSKEQLKNTWLFPIRQDRKNPECPSGTILKNNLSFRLEPYQAIKRLKSGQNVGIYALTGGLMFLDLDVEKGKMKASQEFLSKINPSFCVKTRNGGLQYYYLNDGLYDNQVIKENGVTIGELRTDWYYVVAVGSYVLPDENATQDGEGTYRIIHSLPIASFNGLSGYVLKRLEEKDTTTILTAKKTVQTEISINEHNKRLSDQKKTTRILSKEDIQNLRKRFKK